MILPGHLAAGYLVTLGVVAATGAPLSPYQVNELLVIGTLLGDAPDIDIYFHFLWKKTLSPEKLPSHRRYLTHIPLLWLIAGLGIFLIAANPFVKTIGLLVWLCPWSHFVLDSFEIGVMWLWPFSRRQYALGKKAEEEIPSTNWKELFVNYSKNRLAYLETAITLIALFTFFLTQIGSR